MYVCTYVLRPNQTTHAHTLRPRRCVRFVFLRPKIFTSRMMTYLLLRPARCVCFVFLRPKIFTSRMRTYLLLRLSRCVCFVFYVLFKFQFVREGDQGPPPCKKPLK